jgi:hypothetical protein
MEGAPEKFPRCAKVALLIAAAPALLAAVVYVAAPLLFAPSMGCTVVGDVLVNCPGNKFVEWIVAGGAKIALATWVTVPVAVVLFFLCRGHARRKSAQRF